MQLFCLPCKQKRSWVIVKAGSLGTTISPAEAQEAGNCRSDVPQGAKLSLVMPTSELQFRPSPYLAEAGEEELSAGRAAPLLDAVTILEEDAWALVTAACLGQTGHLSETVLPS